MNSLPTLFPGSNKNAIAAVLRDAIVNLCKVSKIYDGWIEIDGIICISGRVEGQQLVVKVHESFLPQTNGKSVEGKESFGDNKECKEEPSGFRYPHKKKRQRLDSKSEAARNASTATLYDFHVEAIGSSHSVDESFKNGVEDLSVKKNPEFSDSSVDRVAIARDSSDSSGPLSVNFESKVHPIDELQISNDESGLFRGGLLCQQKFESATGEKWSASQASAVIPECRVCGCSFDSSEALSDHNEALHSLFTCLCCFKTFTSRSNLERHSRLHTGHKPYMCGVCGKAFSRKDHLSNHATKHAFKCSTCSKRYADRGSLVSHYHADHCASLTNICDYCNKGFSSQDSFEDHVKIHPQCHLAESGTPENAPNDAHEMTLSIHSSGNRRQGRPNSDSLFTAYRYGSAEKLNSLYTCFVCSQSFDHPLQYSSHLLIHSNEVNVFKCSLCLQVCSTLAHLRQHQALHFSELSEYLGSSDRFDSFACTRCDQRFRNPFHLQLHLERHTRLGSAQLQEYMGVNEINLQDQHRASLVNLDNHLRVMHPTHLEDQSNEKFECIKCNISFRDNSSFTRHMEEHEHVHNTDNGSKIFKRDKRKQMQPKLVVLTKENDVDDRETEVVTSESPELTGQEMRNSVHYLDISPSTGNQSAAGKLENEISCEIRLEPVRKLMSRPFIQHPKDWERLMDRQQSVLSNEKPFGCLVRETVEDRSSPQIIVQSNSFDYSPHTFGDYRLSKGSRSMKHYLPPQRCQSASPPTVTGCLNNNNIVAVPSRPFVCAFCNLKSETFSELDIHCQTEHSRSPCMFCTKTFAQKANRDRHHCLHTGDKPYGCPDCEERFSRGDKLKMHRVRVHGMQYPAAYNNSSMPKDASPPVQDCLTSLSPGLYSCDSMYQQSVKNEQISESTGPQDVITEGTLEEKVALPGDILYPDDFSDENRARDSFSQPLPLLYHQPNAAAEEPNTSRPMPTDS